MSKIKVLFDLKKEYYFNSLYPLYKEMVKDPDYDIYFRIGKDQKRFLWLFLINEKNRIAEWMKKEGYKLTDETEGFDLVVCGDALKDPEKYGKSIKVHLDHGVGIKTLRIRNIVKQKDFHYHVFLEGQYWYDYIKSINWQDKADFHILGIPKLDPFFWAGHYDKKAIIDKLGLDINKKTVLYAPSYKPSCIEYIKDKIADLIPKYNLIIKLHPYSWGGKYVSHSQHTYYEKLAKENPSVFLIKESDYDIYPYMYASDTMISDTSSVINEFLALGKHGIIYELPYNELNHSDGMPVLSIDPKEWLLGAFPHMKSPHDLLPCVQQALNPTDEMKAKLEEYRNYYFTGLDGKSSERVKVKIDEIVGIKA
ncbi:MAG: CDP-glycerol glycerophosphotransferase family protein [Candidatus Delongbacteria bacterium]|nr:CDP-glycerol glycerophosphotransferase family protein [Candidatus Delongbacteria bacterium]MCG2760321.1 CDP-glycerol glycerophosphotransferase family protein [Candidatus Delongbacteria bacterium]